MQVSRYADSKALRKTVRIIPEARMMLIFAAVLIAFAAVEFGIYTLWFSVPIFIVAASLTLEKDFYLPKSPLALAAPMGGKVLNVQRARDPWLERDAWKLIIKPSFLIMSSIHSATEGRCPQQWIKRKGGISYFAALVTTDEGDEVVVEISSRMPLRHRLNIDYRQGDRVGQGQRVGYVLLTASISVYAPINASCLVEAGQAISIAEPVLELVHSTPAKVEVLDGS